MKRSLTSITWAKLEPHSTQRKGRTCKSCHQNPKSLGLGFGKITLKNGGLHFEPLEKPFSETFPYPLSQIVNFKGETLVKFNRPGMRGFKAEELKRILRVGLCLNCHQEDSSVFKNWKRDLRCPKFPQL